jgi:hypothetical protein
MSYHGQFHLASAALHGAQRKLDEVGHGHMSLRLLTVDKMNAIEFEIVEDDDLEVLDFIENDKATLF